MIYFLEGEIIHASLRDHIGLKALSCVAIKNALAPSEHFVVEPEIVDDSLRTIFDSFEECLSFLKMSIMSQRETEKLKPPEHIKLAIIPDFIWEGGPLEWEEFEVLCIVSNYSLVSEIYDQGSLFDFEITQGLVSLRKKNALKVLA